MQLPRRYVILKLFFALLLPVVFAFLVFTPQRITKVNSISTYRKTENRLGRNHRLVRVSPNQVMTTLHRPDKSFLTIYVGRSTCPYCQQFMGTLASSLKFTGETVGYIDNSSLNNIPSVCTLRYFMAHTVYLPIQARNLDIKVNNSRNKLRFNRTYYP